MGFLVEMGRLEEVGDAVIGIIIDEDRAQQSLLRLDIVRGDAERHLRFVYFRESIRRSHWKSILSDLCS